MECWVLSQFFVSSISTELPLSKFIATQFLGQKRLTIKRENSSSIKANWSNRTFFHNMPATCHQGLPLLFLLAFSRATGTLVRGSLQHPAAPLGIQFQTPCACPSPGNVGGRPDRLLPRGSAGGQGHVSPPWVSSWSCGGTHCGRDSAIDSRLPVAYVHLKVLDAAYMLGQFCHLCCCRNRSVSCKAIWL